MLLFFVGVVYRPEPDSNLAILLHHPAGIETLPLDLERNMILLRELDESAESVYCAVALAWLAPLSHCRGIWSCRFFNAEPCCRVQGLRKTSRHRMLTSTLP